MTTLHNEIVISASPDVVWQKLSKLDALSDYDPSVGSVSMLEGANTGIGAGRRCVLREGGWFEERVTEWDPRHALAFVLIACTLPVRALRHRYALSEAGAGTRIEQTMEYTLKYGAIGAALDAIVVRRRWNEGIKAFFAGLKANVEGAHPARARARVEMEAR